MLSDVLSQFPQHVLPLLCNAAVSVTSECRHSDGITSVLITGLHSSVFV